ncbi:MAG: recombination protein RecR, partial [Bacteroidales bacterium]
ELKDRISKGDVREMILALSTSMEGETTSFYLFKQVSVFPITISTIARGVGFGDDLEYTDELTLGRSIQNRQLYKPQ